MGIYYVVVALLVLSSLRLRRNVDATACLAPSQTVCINGICILLVFVAHIGHVLLQPMGYEMSSVLDRVYLKIHCTCGQLIVVPFLFYSGYGVATQMMTKPGYLAGFLRSRVLTLWLNYLVAMVLFLLVTVAFVEPVRGVDILKSLVFLQSFDSPKWFLFCTMASYVVVWLAFKLSPNKLCISATCIGGMLLYIGVVSRYRPLFWYDTALMFPIGVLVALYKGEVFSLLSKRYWTLVVALSITFLLLLFKLPRFYFGVYGACLRTNLLGAMLMALIVLFTMRICVANKLFLWLGKHVFPIYVYHLLFFLCAKTFVRQPVRGGGHLLVMSIFALTLVTAYLYRFWRIDTQRIGNKVII